MAEQLKDKVAIVTGASSGLGEAIALLFAARGAKVTLHGRDEERLKSVLDQAIQASGGHKDRFHVVQGDVTSKDVRKNIVEQTIEKFGRVDVLVPNAGLAAPGGQILDATEESYDLMMNTNLKSVFFLIQLAVPHLEKSKGAIISLSSMTSSLVCAPSIVYPTSKAALDHLSRCLALDLGPKGIRVNTVNPSFIPTRVRRAFGAEAKVSEWSQAESTLQPLEGRIGTPQDVAETVAFLASDAGNFITGQNIKIDGGRAFTGPYGQPKKST